MVLDMSYDRRLHIVCIARGKQHAEIFRVIYRFTLSYCLRNIKLTARVLQFHSDSALNGASVDQSQCTVTRGTAKAKSHRACLHPPA